jgi:hypothetical protein
MIELTQTAEIVISTMLAGASVGIITFGVRWVIKSAKEL